MQLESSVGHQVIADTDPHFEHGDKNYLRLETNMQMAVMEQLDFVSSPDAKENEEIMTEETARRAVDRWIEWGLSASFRELFTKKFQAIKAEIVEKARIENSIIEPLEVHTRALKEIAARSKKVISEIAVDLKVIVDKKMEEMVTRV